MNIYVKFVLGYETLALTILELQLNWLCVFAGKRLREDAAEDSSPSKKRRGWREVSEISSCIFIFLYQI